MSGAGDDAGMDDVRIGRILRALRRRRGWRQVDLAARVGCHQTTISRMERGHLASLSVDLVRRAFAELDARFEGVITWRGGQLDRLLDERHADVVEVAARIVRADAWLTLAEVTFAEYGERGSIDLLAVREDVRTVAVMEMKSDITSIEETHRRHDVKVRLARAIVRERFGWEPMVVGRILVVPEDRTIRRVVERHSATFASSYPARNREVRRWLRDPNGPIAGLWFVTVKHRRAGTRTAGGTERVRVRRPKRAA